jgi:hypothetical protein
MKVNIVLLIKDILPQDNELIKFKRAILHLLFAPAKSRLS